MKKLTFAVFTLMFILTACGQATPVAITATPKPPPATATPIPLTVTPTPEAGIFTYEQALPLFNYDASSPFDLYVSSEKEVDGIIIQEVAYKGVDSQYLSKTIGKIVAYLVKPAKSGTYAGILFQHGYGVGFGNRKQFLDEATNLAHYGVVSLLPIGITPWMVRYTGNADEDQLNTIKQIIELRRSLDFLLAQPGVDPQRIAFVAHDYGAMHGAVLSGVEKRIKTYVLMTGDSNYSDWAIHYLHLTTPATADRYRKLMAAVGPLAFLPHAAPAELFFQFAGNDQFVMTASANASFAAASEPKKFGWYANTGHLLDAQSSKERLNWLIAKLGLKPVE